jgi:CelD/BcsL family acetyltransferase involved in cellulose biosynthesis
MSAAVVETTAFLDVRWDPTLDDALAAQWDALLTQSDANIVFLTSGWLRAWHETLGRDATVLFGQVRHHGQLVGAAAFQVAQGVIEFAGKGPSDYSDFIIRESIDDVLRGEIIARLLQLAKRETPRFRHFKLGRLQPESKTAFSISEHAHGLHATAIGPVEAPFMDMCLVEDRLRKKSLRRHERGLERQGTVTTETLTTADEILPLLDAFFFDQHVARWKSVGIESLFTQTVSRDFYRAVTRRLGATGQLRFTVIRLAEAPIAAHFGFLQAGRFIWYKPSYEPTLSKLSPGEVLIKRLMEQAKHESAREFDFTIGSEPFKFRFASGVRVTRYLHVTDSRFAACARRGRALARRTLRWLMKKDQTT